MVRNTPSLYASLTSFALTAASLPSNIRSDLPVLCLFGTGDATCPPVAVRNSKKFIEQLRVVPVSDVGHWVMLEAPEAVTEEVLQWLEEAGLNTKKTARL